MKSTSLAILSAIFIMMSSQIGTAQGIVTVDLDQEETKTQGLTDHQAIAMMGQAEPTAPVTQNGETGYGIIDHVAIGKMLENQKGSEFGTHGDQDTDYAQTDTDIILSYQASNPFKVHQIKPGESVGLTDHQAIELARVHFGTDPNAPKSYVSESVLEEEIVVRATDRIEVEVTASDRAESVSAVFPRSGNATKY